MTQMHLAVTNSLLDKALRYHRKGELKKAIPLLQAAVEHDPFNPDVLYWAGVALLGMRDYKGGVAFLEHAKSLDPGQPAVWYNLGVAYDASGRWESARKAYEQALVFHPNDVLPMCNLGGVLYRLGEPAQGYAMHSRALAVEGATVEEQAGRALIRLLRGDWATGWAEYEGRWSIPAHMHQNKRPKQGKPWQGEDYRGQRILLHAEQGVGDTIQFLRYVATIAADGVNVVLQVQAELKRLLTSYPGTVEVISHQERPSKPCDWYASLMSLPHLIVPNATRTFIPPAPYLAAPRLNGPPIYKLPGLRVGLCLKGNPHHMNDHDRSMPVRYAQPLLTVLGVTWVSLHGQVIPNLPMVQVEVQDFADTAAVIAQLDLVITIDSAVAHLSAAMGTPTWLLQPCSPEFRWGLGERSPWYPDVKLYRRTHVRDWASVVERVCTDLAREAR